MSNIVPIAENTKWYYRDGKPCTELPSADGKKMVSPTVVHARKLWLLPSVTCILQTISEPYLEQWKIEQALLVSLGNPKAADETDEGYLTRICSMAKDVVSLKADRGKEMHAEIEMSLNDPSYKTQDPACQVALQSIHDRIEYYAKEYGQKPSVTTEGTFANEDEGFAGRYDICLTFNFGIQVFLDVKTTDIAKFNKPYQKWGLQGAGYMIGMRTSDASVFEQVVVDRTSGETQFHTWDKMSEMKIAFLGLRNAWCILNNLKTWK